MTENLDPYQSWQLEKYGNVLATPQISPDGEAYEAGTDELNRMAEWMDMQAEIQMYEDAR